MPALLLVLAVAANPRAADARTPEARPDVEKPQAPSSPSVLRGPAGRPSDNGAAAAATSRRSGSPSKERGAPAVPQRSADVPRAESASRAASAVTASPSVEAPRPEPPSAPIASREPRGVATPPSAAPRPPASTRRAAPAPIDLAAAREEDAAIDGLLRTAEPPSDGHPAQRNSQAPPQRSPGNLNAWSTWRVGAGVVGAARTLPHASWGATGTAGISSRRGSAALEVRFDTPSSLTTANGEVTVWTATAWAVPCLHSGALAGCALIGGGILHGRGAEVRAARSGTSPWFGGGLRAEVRVPISGGAAFTIHADGLFVPMQTVVELGVPPAEVWRTPRFTGAVGLGLVYDVHLRP